MKHSDTLTKLAPALLKAQASMQAAAKSATNPHFRSKYADLATVIDATKAPLNDNEIIVLQSITSDSSGVMVETTLLHTSGEWIADTLYLPVPTQTPQAYGSAITYGRRYGLQSLVCLPAEDDDGNKASADSERPAKMATKTFVDHCTALGSATSVEELQKAFTVAVMAARQIGDTEAERSFVAKKDELKATYDTRPKRALAEQA